MSTESSDYPDPMMMQPGPSAAHARAYAYTMILGILGLLATGWLIPTVCLAVIVAAWWEVKDKE